MPVETVAARLERLAGNLAHIDEHYGLEGSLRHRLDDIRLELRAIAQAVSA